VYPLASHFLILAAGVPHPAARGVDADALGQVEDRGAEAALIRALDDSDPVVRRLAAQALGELNGDRRAPARLITALGDRDPELRIIAARSLGEIGDTAAAPALAGAYQSHDPRLRYAVVTAMSELDGHHADAVLQLARNDSDQIVRHKAAQVLKDRDDDD
jgi:HEAT repeat protein